MHCICMLFLLYTTCILGLHPFVFKININSNHRREVFVSLYITEEIAQYIFDLTSLLKLYETRQTTQNGTKNVPFELSQKKRNV